MVLFDILNGSFEKIDSLLEKIPEEKREEVRKLIIDIVSKTLAELAKSKMER